MAFFIRNGNFHCISLQKRCRNNYKCPVKSWRGCTTNPSLRNLVSIVGWMPFVWAAFISWLKCFLVLVLCRQVSGFPSALRSICWTVPCVTVTVSPTVPPVKLSTTENSLNQWRFLLFATKERFSTFPWCTRRLSCHLSLATVASGGTFSIPVNSYLWCRMGTPTPVSV